MTRVRVVTVAGDIDRETLLAEALGLRSDVELVLRCLDRVELLATIRGGRLDAIVVVGSVEWFDRQIAAEIADRQLAVVALADDPPSHDVSTVLPSGTSLDGIVQACTSSPSLLVSADRTDQGSGRLTAVWGPKGSPGRTRTAIDLAFVLEQTGIDTLLMDADPYGGDVLQALSIVDEIPTVIWAARMAAKGELDDERLCSHLRRAGTGPVVMAGLPRAELWPEVSDFGFGELLHICRNAFGHTVMDVGFCLEPDPSPFSEGGEGRNRLALRAIRTADRVVAVCDARPIGIKNFLWAFEDLTSKIDLDNVVVVAARVVPGTEQELSRLLAKHTGKRPVAYVPDKPDLMRKALEAGAASVEQKDAADVKAAVEALAISVGAKLKPRGLLTRLGARG